MMRYCLFSIVGFIILCIVSVGCGGNDWDTIAIEGSAGGAKMKDGRVVIENKTPWEVEVNYFLREDEVRPGSPFGERVYIVQPVETKMFDEIIVGGTKVILKFEHRPGFEHPVFVERELVINGNVGFRMKGSTRNITYDSI